MVSRSHILKVAELGSEYALLDLENHKVLQHPLPLVTVERGGE